MRPGAGKLRIAKLSAGYGKQAAVMQAELEVGDGAFVGIVGPNGAGKTSLINALNGTLRRWHGAIDWRGQDVSSLAPSARVRLGISTVPQGAAAFPGITVARNIEIALSASKAADAEAAELAISLFPELAPKWRLNAGTLSGGQRQMLAIARAIAQKPSLLLLDEPSFGLAVGVRQRVIAMLAEFRRRTGCAVLMAEQDVTMIEGAERIYFMSAGRLQQVR